MKRAPARLRLRAGSSDPVTLAAFIAVRGGVPEELARGAIARGGAYLKGRRVREPEAPVARGDEVEVILRGEEPAAALSRERILHLDEHLVAVDKPAGVAAQEGRAGGPSLPDLCSALLGGPALLVHRLDRGTTGVTLLARTKEAQRALLDEFQAHRVAKEYRALVAGAPARMEGIVDVALGAAPDGSRRPDPHGEAARTRFQVLERLDGASLVAAFPETGRTHQVRVHLRGIGCPLLGDGRYGGPLQLTRPSGARIDFARPMLHALSISLAHPQGGTLSVTAPAPVDFTAALQRLR